MSRFLPIVQVGIFFFISAILSGQHLSIDIPILLETDIDGNTTQSIDISTLKVHDFVAVSILLEGNEMNNSACTGVLKTSSSQYNILPFNEETSEHRFISEIIYVSVIEIGRLNMELKFNKGIDITKIKGKIHIFSPQSKKEPKRLKQSLGNVNNESNCVCPLPPYVSRDDWGISFGLDENIFIPPAAYSDVTHLIVHHSAGTNVSTNWQGVVASIFDFHVYTNGWQDIGYNWLIDPEGFIYLGRGGGDNVKGAHMCGYNTNTMGICVLGNFENILPSPEAIMALKKIIAWKSCKEDIPPFGMGPILSYSGHMNFISGHRNGCAPNYTTCPGPKLYDLLDSIKQITVDFTTESCLTVENKDLPSKASTYFFPNPVIDMITFRFDILNGTRDFLITDDMGKTVGRFSYSDETEKIINVNNLDGGIYFVKCISGHPIGPFRFVKIY